MPTKCRTIGRPPQDLVRTYVASMLATIRGISPKRALEVIESDPDTVPGTLWSLAAKAVSDGIRDRESFDKWLRSALGELCRKAIP